MKIQIENEDFDDVDNKARIICMLYGAEAFRTLSDFRTFLRGVAKYGNEKISVETAELMIEEFNKCLEGENMQGLFYDNFY